MMNYIALLRKEQTSDYGVEFPDFPGCIPLASPLMKQEKWQVRL